MLELEQEIFDPSGISTVDPPKMILEGVLISKPCGILYHIDGSTGVRYDAPSRSHSSVSDESSARGNTAATPSHVRCRSSQSRDIQPKMRVVDAGWSTIIYLVMLFLLSRQITVSRTPAAISRLSRWTFFTQALIDTLTFVIVGLLRYHLSRLTLGIPQLISLAIAVSARASIPLIAPAALAVILLVYEMVSPHPRSFGSSLLKDVDSNSPC